MKKLYLFTAIFVFCLIFFGMFFPLLVHVRQTPPGTKYFYADGFIPDYYQYISWVRDGQEGKILLTNRYTEKEHKQAFIHTIFPLSGYFFGLLNIDPFRAYLYLRIFSAVVFLCTIIFFINKICPDFTAKITSLILLFSATGVWRTGINGTALETPVPWTAAFNVINKFNVPPHHHLALSAFLVSLILLGSKNNKPARFLILFLLGFAITFLNPSTGIFAFLVIFMLFILRFFKEKMPAKKDLLPLIFLGSGILLLLIYFKRLFALPGPWQSWYVLARAYNPPVALRAYILSLGPVFFLSLLSFLSLKKCHTAIFWSLAFWAYLPVILFIIPSGLSPFSTPRLFQSYQYIPLSILASLGLHKAVISLNRNINIQIFLQIAVSLIFLCYSAVPYINTLKWNASYLRRDAFNVYVPDDLYKALIYLRIRTPKQSVCLSGEFISGMIPAFSHNLVLFGRDDADSGYYTKLEEALSFFKGSFGEDEARDFLQKHNISYILFRSDLKTPSAFLSKSYPFLTKVFAEDSAMIFKFEPAN